VYRICLRCFKNNYNIIDIDDLAFPLGTISVGTVQNCLSQIFPSPGESPYTQQICISYTGTDENNYFATPSYFNSTFTMKYYDTSGNEVSSTNSTNSKYYSFYKNSNYSWEYQNKFLLVQNNQMV